MHLSRSDDFGTIWRKAGIHHSPQVLVQDLGASAINHPHLDMTKRAYVPAQVFAVACLSQMLNPRLTSHKYSPKNIVDGTSSGEPQINHAYSKVLQISFAKNCHSLLAP